MKVDDVVDDLCDWRLLVTGNLLSRRPDLLNLLYSMGTRTVGGRENFHCFPVTNKKENVFNSIGVNFGNLIFAKGSSPSDSALENNSNLSEARAGFSSFPVRSTSSGQSL